MLTVYGMTVCPNTQAALAALEKAGIPFDFKNFGDAVQNLKEFLHYRDDPAYSAIFDPVRKAGGVGIPLFVLPDGKVTKDLAEALKVHA